MRKEQENADVLRSALQVILTSTRGDQHAHQWDIRKWLDEHGVFNGDIQASRRLVEAVCVFALGAPSPSTGAPGEWKGIESAPQDCRAIIGKTWDGHVHPVWWNKTYPRWEWCSDGYHSGAAPRLTHWMRMSLPSPPLLTEGETPPAPVDWTCQCGWSGKVWIPASCPRCGRASTTPPRVREQE